MDFAPGEIKDDLVVDVEDDVAVKAVLLSPLVQLLPAPDQGLEGRPAGRTLHVVVQGHRGGHLAPLGAGAEQRVAPPGVDGPIRHGLDIAVLVGVGHPVLVQPRHLLQVLLDLPVAPLLVGGDVELPLAAAVEQGETGVLDPLVEGVLVLLLECPLDLADGPELPGVDDGGVQQVVAAEVGRLVRFLKQLDHLLLAGLVARDAKLDILVVQGPPLPAGGRAEAQAQVLRIPLLHALLAIPGN